MKIISYKYLDWEFTVEKFRKISTHKFFEKLKLPEIASYIAYFDNWSFFSKFMGAILMKLQLLKELIMYKKYV